MLSGKQIFSCFFKSNSRGDRGLVIRPFPTQQKIVRPYKQAVSEKKLDLIAHQIRKIPIERISDKNPHKKIPKKLDLVKSKK